VEITTLDTRKEREKKVLYSSYKIRSYIIFFAETDRAWDMRGNLSSSMFYHPNIHHILSVAVPTVLKRLPMDIRNVSPHDKSKSVWKTQTFKVAFTDKQLLSFIYFIGYLHTSYCGPWLTPACKSDLLNLHYYY